MGEAWLAMQGIEAAARLHSGGLQVRHQLRDALTEQDCAEGYCLALIRGLQHSYLRDPSQGRAIARQERALTGDDRRQLVELGETEGRLDIGDAKVCAEGRVYK